MENRRKLLELTKSKTGIELKNTLYNELSPLAINDYNQISYDKMKDILLKELTEKGLYGGNDLNDKDINCEHIWPQSFFNKEYPMRSDMNHCFFTHRRLNSHRNTYKFGNLDNATITYINQFGIKIKDISCLYSKKCNIEDMFEPIDVSKGNVARAVAYFYTMYPNYNISKVMDISTMIEWHCNDPVDINEEIRTNVIYKHQKNYNPYIVCPELLERVFNELKPINVEERITNIENKLDVLIDLVQKSLSCNVK